MRRSIAAIVLSMAGAIAVTGCGAPQRVSADPLGAAPTDFALEVTILTPAPATTQPTSTAPATAPTAAPATMPAEAHLRQSRYVLFSDGSLHQGEDSDHSKGAEWLPPITRVLSRRQIAEVWSLAQQLGFNDPKNAGNSAINFRTVPPPSEGAVVYLMAFRGWGQWWTFTRNSPMDHPDPAMTEMVRALAQLAWASDMPATEPHVVPRRYDFGADPYERYRQPGGAPAAAATRPKTPTGNKP